MPDVRERLKGILRPGGYDPGDRVEALVKDIDGVERRAEFEIKSFCGGGFAGQVYRTVVVRSEANWLAPGAVVALKFFSTRSGFRRLFRDILYFIAFQGPFPHHYNECAVRTGLFVTKLLRLVAKVEFGTETPINDTYGTFWDEHVGAFAEAYDWVEGRVSDPDVDPDIFIRRAHNKKVRSAQRRGDMSAGPLLESHTEIAKKKRFMTAIVKLCGELGLEDLARQVYWWTGMSQPNVLTRNGSDSDEHKFVWVDRRPGLPGFLLSLGDFPLLAKAILRGSIPPFDRVNFKKLRSWAKAPDRKAWEALVDRFEEVDTAYRRSQLDLIGHNVRLLISGRLWRDIIRGIIEYWRRTGRVDGKTADRLARGSLSLPAHILLSIIPIIGRRLQKLLGSADYRTHIRRMLLDSRYRWQYFDQGRKVNLAAWLRDNRVSDGRAERLLGSLPKYFRDRVCFSWLPASWQRFFTDWACAKDSLRRLFTSPFKYIFNMGYRRKVNLDWVRERTAEDVKHGYVSEEEAGVFVSIAGADAMQQYVTGIMVTLALQPASEIVLLTLAAILGVRVAMDASMFQQVFGHLGWWSAPLVLLFVAVSPAGVLRFVYCVTQWVRNRHVPYGTATALALWRAVGDLAFVVQTAKTYPQFSRYLLTSSICHLVNIVPVFGERGGLLNIWATAALLSWPASFRAWRGWRKNPNPDGGAAA